MTDAPSSSPVAALEDDELDDMLASMDIDKDYNLWSSFRSSVRQSRGSSLGAADDQGLECVLEESPSEAELRAESDDIAAWASRLARDEVYSRRYRPTPEEQVELLDLERMLGLGPRRSLRDMLFRRRSDGSTASVGDDEAVWNRLVHPEATAPASILLKRGPVLVDDAESELLLLTHGLVLADVEDGPKKSIRRQFATAVEWATVDYVAPTSSTALAIHLTNSHDSVMDIECVNERQHAAWMAAFARILVQHRMHAPNAPHDRGWQYRLVHRPAFTMAVSGQTNLVVDQQLDQVDWHRLDDYQQYAPLHYAVRGNHVAAVERLLAAGADPNVEDGDGRTPMYYCVKDQLSPMMKQTLQAHGAQASALAETETSGELFGRVAATERQVEAKREQHRAEQQRQAEAAAAKMAENMAALQRRGEKIDEMGAKAGELHEGAMNYADMARQLKEQSKKKSNWFGL